jgi:hypothetical protein
VQQLSLFAPQLVRPGPPAAQLGSEFPAVEPLHCPPEQLLLAQFMVTQAVQPLLPTSQVCWLLASEHWVARFVHALVQQAPALQNPLAHVEVSEA